MFIARFFRQTTKSASQNKSVQNGVFREWFFCVNMSRWSWHLMWIEEDKLEIIFLESKQTSFDELIALQRPIGAIKLVSLRFFLFDTYLLERCEMNSKTCVLFCKNIMPTIRIFMFKISLINLSAHLQMTWWHITKYTNQKEKKQTEKKNEIHFKWNAIFEFQWQTNYDLYKKKMKKRHSNGLSQKTVTKCRKEAIRKKRIAWAFVLSMLILKRKWVGVSACDGQCWCNPSRSNQTFSKWQPCQYANESIGIRHTAAFQVCMDNKF